MIPNQFIGYDILAALNAVFISKRFNVLLRCFRTCAGGIDVVAYLFSTLCRGIVADAL